MADMGNNAAATSPSAPVGIFDSGVGGLSVLKAIWQELPDEHLLYVADQAHVPYGVRTLEEVRSFSAGVTRYLLGQGAKLVVVACNSASAAALHGLRLNFPSVPFVGMEPAVKPAAERTRSRVVGVLATPVTFQGELYASLVERFARDVEVLQNACPGLVAQIEAGEFASPATRQILEDALLPMLRRGVDRVVLGCTHYPFVIPLIQEITGPQVEVIDPAPAVARQVRRLLGERGLLRPAGGTPAETHFYTSGDAARLQALLPQFLSAAYPVSGLRWQGDRLV